MKIQYLCPLLQVFDEKYRWIFYCGILGFEIHERAGEKDDIGWVWLTLNALNLILNTRYELSLRPAYPEADRDKVHSDSNTLSGLPRCKCRISRTYSQKA